MADGRHWRSIEKLPHAEAKAFESRFRSFAKFYTDANIEPVLVEILRDLGFDVMTAKEAHLENRDDLDHYSHARRTKRILVSHDQDFLDDRKFPPRAHPGVVVLDIQPLTRETISDAFYLLRAVVRPYREIWKGAKIVIHKNLEMRVRMNDFQGKLQDTRYRLTRQGAQEWVD